MLVRVENTYKLDKKERLGDTLRRLESLFQQAEVPYNWEASFQESFGESSSTALERFFKRYPQHRGLEQTVTIPGIIPYQLQSLSANQDTFPFALLCEVADGIPRSYPFPIAITNFTSNSSNPATITVALYSGALGRKATLTASYQTQIPDNAKAPAPPPSDLAPLFELLGKPAKSSRAPVEATPIDPRPLIEIIQTYRRRMLDISHEANLPHQLPPLQEALTVRAEPHPLKPTLVARFEPLGFSCKGGSGIFNLRRKTPGNHVIGLMLDVGTYSRLLTAQFEFFTLGYRAVIPLPVAAGTNPPQYPIGSPEQWAKLVDNLATLLLWLEPTLIRELEAAAPPAPSWFDAPVT